MANILSQLEILLHANTANFSSDLNRAASDAAKAMGSMQKKAAIAAKGVAIGFAAVSAAVVGVGAALIPVQRQFDQMNAQLVTATGSTENAAIAMEALNKFAAQTPYDLEQSVIGFTKLVNLGLTPSERAMKSYGNTASAMGKSMEQMIEAVADAATSEFERLKEFGIKSSKEGNRVTFTFRGIKTEVGNNAAEIEKYLMDLGEVEFAGAMEAQMDTLNGRISQAEIAFDQFRLAIVQSGIGDMIKSAVEMAIEALEALTRYIESGQLTALIKMLGVNFESFSTVAVGSIDRTKKTMGTGLSDMTSANDKSLIAMAQKWTTWSSVVQATVASTVVKVIAWLDKVAINAEAAAEIMSNPFNIKKVGAALIYREGMLRKSAAREEELLTGIDTRFDRQMTKISSAREEAQAAQLALQNTVVETGDVLAQFGDARTAQEEAEDKAAKKAKGRAAAKANQIKAEIVNQRVLGQALTYNYAMLEKQYNLPQGILAAVSMQESRGNPNARSPVGAKGAFQFMPGTAKRFGIGGQEGNVAKSAEAAAKYLSKLQQEFGSIELALAGYNAGEGNVKKYGNKIPPFKETQKYVPKVMAYLAFMQGGLDGSVSIGANIASQNAEQERLLEEQMRREQEQALKRKNIRKELADEVTRIEMELVDKLAEIDGAGFDDKEAETRRIQAAKRATIEIEEFQAVQNRKLADLESYRKLEKDLIVDNANESIAAILRDEDLTEKQQKYAAAAIREKARYELDVLEHSHRVQMQYVQAYQQTEAERITNHYALERREILMTINMDEELRKAKIESIKAAEELALEDLRLSHQRELRALITDDKSELKALRDSYREQREALDRRTDIDDGQKSELRNKLAGAEQFAVGQYGMGVGAQVDSLQAELGGYSEQKALTDQRAARLELIKQADELEILQGQALYDAKLAVEKDYQRQSQALMLSNAEQQFGATTELMKMAFGEQHTLYKAAFLAQKAMAIGQALINIPESYSKAFNAVVGIPIVGPGLAPIAGAAAAALQVAQKVMISKVQPPSMPGFFSGGYTGDIPTTSVAGSVHGQEFVANAKVTKQYRPELEAMHKGTYDKKASGNVVNIHNYTGAKVTQRKDGNGDLEILIGEELSKQLPNHVNDPSSKFNKALRDQYHLQRSL